MEGCGHVVRVGDAWCSEDAGRVAGRWPVRVGNQGVIHGETNSKVAKITNKPSEINKQTRST